MKKHIENWLRDIVDDAESISKYHYEEHIEYLKKQEIPLDGIRQKIFQENFKNKAIIEEFLENRYETWKSHEEEKEKMKRMQYLREDVPKEPGGVSLTKQISLVLYELKDKDPVQFNLFCETFL